jgi:rare lipoprotein A
MNALTAAHPKLPFGTRVRVRNARNGREVVVRINDRGPFTGGRIIDLSRAAAEAIGLIQAGVGPVVLLRP